MVLSVTNLSGFGTGTGSPYLYDIIRELGLTANLNFCLDVADTRSYNGTSQTWTDITGNGNSFYRGTSSGGDAQDPTFNGTIGDYDESTYFSLDGGDWFVQSGAQTYPFDWHKDNGAFSLVFLVYFANVSTSQVLFNTFHIANGDGIIVFLDNAGPLYVTHATSAAGFQAVNSTLTPPATTWSTVGVSFNEATTTMESVVNSASSSVTFAASTNTTNPSATFTIGSDDAANELTAGSRLIAVASWNVAIGAAALKSIYLMSKTRRLTSMP